MTDKREDRLIQQLTARIKRRCKALLEQPRRHRDRQLCESFLKDIDERAELLQKGGSDEKN